MVAVWEWSWFTHDFFYHERHETTRTVFLSEKEDGVVPDGIRDCRRQQDVADFTGEFITTKRIM